MALCHLPNPSLSASRELQPFAHASKLAEERVRWDAQQGLTGSRGLSKPMLKFATSSVSLYWPWVFRSTTCLQRRSCWNMGGRTWHILSEGEDIRKSLNFSWTQQMERMISAKFQLKNLLFHTFTEGQETQDNVNNMPAEPSHERLTSCSQGDESEIIGDFPESEDTLIHNGHEFSSSINNTHSLDEGILSSQLSFPPSRGQYSNRGDVSPEDILGNSDLSENKASDLAEETPNQEEINHLRELLRQKEMELELLKQQIEEEKFALSVMQNKAHSEISKVQNIISIKDKELHAAEESLAGLKEVLIEYWGNGETVEVAGSFNGWQHRVKLDPHASSKTSNPTGRESILWSTILWLYPGIYEIKFVVDGHWKIDSQREFVTKGNITNNILKIDR